MLNYIFAAPNRAGRFATKCQVLEESKGVKVKTLICNCKGLIESFRNADMNTLPFQIETELDVDYAIVHPELCGQGGNEVLEDVLRSAASEPDTYIVVAGCSPEMQLKLFKKVFRSTGFDEKHFVGVDIRGSTNDEILDRLQEKIEALLPPGKKPH